MARKIDISKMPEVIDAINAVLTNGNPCELKVEALRGVCVIELRRTIKKAELDK